MEIGTKSDLKMLGVFLLAILIAGINIFYIVPHNRNILIQKEKSIISTGAIVYEGDNETLQGQCSKINWLIRNQNIANTYEIFLILKGRSNLENNGIKNYNNLPLYSGWDLINESTIGEINTNNIKYKFTYFKDKHCFLSFNIANGSSGSTITNLNNEEVIFKYGFSSDNFNKRTSTAQAASSVSPKIYSDLVGFIYYYGQENNLLK